jgi:hypothetical protein
MVLGQARLQWRSLISAAFKIGVLLRHSKLAVPRCHVMSEEGKFQRLSFAGYFYLAVRIVTDQVATFSLL